MGVLIDETTEGEIPDLCDQTLNELVAEWLGWTWNLERSHTEAAAIPESSERPVSPDGEERADVPDYINGTGPVGCAWDLHSAMPGLLGTSKNTVTLHRSEEPVLVTSEDPGDRTSGYPGNRGMAEIAATLAVRGIEPRGAAE